jgi:hypothetical protein
MTVSAAYAAAALNLLFFPIEHAVQHCTECTPIFADVKAVQATRMFQCCTHVGFEVEETIVLHIT